MDFEFKVPSAIPQDLLLIQDLIGSVPPPTLTPKNAMGDESNDDSIASSDNEADSEDEVEADLLPCDEDNGIPTTTPESQSSSESESDTSFASDSEDDDSIQEQSPLSQPGKPTADDDDESGVASASTYLQTKNEVVDANIVVPTITEVEPTDILEKVGEVMSIVGNVVIVKGLPADHVKSPSERALDADSLLVFEDRKVLGYIYETFGPTSQPLYQVKFNQHHPLDTDKVRLSREVFHVPQRSHFVFVDQLKKLRGSDASNIHDEEPAEDEIEFSDDEQEAVFKAQRKKKRGHSVSSSRQSTPAPSRVHFDDMVDDSYRGANPYDAHGPYDDDYHVAGPSRPPPVPYDDPYAEPPSSDAYVSPMEPVLNPLTVGENGRASDGDSLKATCGRFSGRGARGRGDRNRQSRNSSRRGFHSHSGESQRPFAFGTNPSFSATYRVGERGTGYEQASEAIPGYLSATNSWSSLDTNSIQNYSPPFVQPHINPRFASSFGINLPLGSMIPWGSQNASSYPSQSQQWADAWTVHGGTGSEAEGDTYTPM